MSSHVALKCTYNDGGEGELVGFAAPCSKRNMKRNIEEGRVWCSENESPCRLYYEREFKGNRPVKPCYESHLFTDWVYGCGMYHHGYRKDTPIPATHVGKEKIAVLTTRFPGDSEEQRKIIGLYQVGGIISEPGESVKIVASRGLRVRLSLKAAKALLFWKYFSVRGGKARWGTGLHRYLNNNQIAWILADVQLKILNVKQRATIGQMLKTRFKDDINLRPQSTVKSKGDSLVCRHVKKAGKIVLSNEEYRALCRRSVKLTTAAGSMKDQSPNELYAKFIGYARDSCIARGRGLILVNPGGYSIQPFGTVTMQCSYVPLSLNQAVLPGKMTKRMKSYVPRTQFVICLPGDNGTGNCYVIRQS